MTPSIAGPAISPRSQHVALWGGVVLITSFVMLTAIDVAFVVYKRYRPLRC